MPPRPDRPLKGGRILTYRHPVLVRVTHWINLTCLILLLGSGLQILCAHPAFYWGEVSRFDRPWAEISSAPGADGALRGRVAVLGVGFDSTGILGAVRSADGGMTARAAPPWATLPAELDLGAGRRWHFFFAWFLVINGGAYLAHGLATGRLRRSLIPTARQWAGLGHSVLEHLRLRFDHGQSAREYNVLQKLAYAAVVLGLLPLMLLTGLAMSPTVDAAAPLLTSVLGGRQSARSLHFLAASGLVLFALAHVVMVVLAGPINQLRSMITGGFVIQNRGPRR